MKIDDVEKTLDADGKFSSQEDFEKELKLKVELEGYGKKEVTHTMSLKPEDNVVNIDVTKKEVQRKKSFTSLDCF